MRLSFLGIAVTALGKIAHAQQCFPLSNSASCPDFSGFSVFPDSKRYSDLAGFDSYVKTISGVSPSYVNYIKQTFSCPNWDGSGLLYMNSFTCALIINLSPNCNQNSTANQLCKSTANSTIASFQSVFGNQAFCPGNSQRTIPPEFTNFFNKLTRNSPPTDCVASTKPEADLCGFSTSVETKAYCAVNPGQACCAQANKAGNTSSGSSSVNTSPIIIALSVIGSLVFAVCTGLLLYYYIKNQNKVSGFKIRHDPTPEPEPATLEPHFSMAPSLTRTEYSSVREHSLVSIAETMEVIYDYEPNLSDEIELHVGDKVIVKCRFDDGWAFGFNISTKAEGSFPVPCLKAIQTTGNQSDDVLNIYTDNKD